MMEFMLSTFELNFMKIDHPIRPNPDTEIASSSLPNPRSEEINREFDTEESRILRQTDLNQTSDPTMSDQINKEILRELKLKKGELTDPVRSNGRR